MSTHITLVRHAESEDNKRGVFGGWRDEPLTARGQAQCAFLRDLLGSHHFDVVVTSGLLRARTTAAAITKGRGLLAMQDVRWNEVGFGLWEGYTFDEVQRRYPGEVETWLAHPLESVPPEGESFSMMYNRVRAALKELLGDQRNRRVCIVSHGGPIRAALAHLLGLPLTFALHVDIDLASVSYVEWYDGHGVLSGLNIGGEGAGGCCDHGPRDRV